MAQKQRRIGVYVCHCGGNISDYVDVHRVAEAVRNDPNVEVSRTHTFACSDAAQQEMIDEIKEKKLDGLVIASCSPKLHMFTFRGMAQRADLNQYQYVHVNLREQCSWVHGNDKEGATEKGINILRAGIAKCALTVPLDAIRIETKPRVLVLGAGVAGMRAAVLLADMGLSVFIVEKDDEPGGWAAKAGRMGPEGQPGTEVVANLLERVKKHENIMLYTGAEITGRSGSIGNFEVTAKLNNGEDLSLNVGAIVAATGFKPYEPAEGEYGWGAPGVVSLLDFRKMLAEAKGGSLQHNGKPVRTVAFIYCVGSRQTKSESCPEPNAHCSRYCCTATTYTASMLSEVAPSVAQYHLYRDIRTYGALEMVYEKARANGARFLRWDPASPPTVAKNGNGLSVKIKDTLAEGDELEIDADLVVLASGMEPRDNESLNEILKIPESTDGFYKEIHIKLRPVETVIDGVFIAGAAQGPKTLAESVASALAAVAKAGGLLKKGYVDLEPLVAKVNTDACIWCDECLKACPYGAIEKVHVGEKEIAFVVESMCKGEGACVPVCPHDAIEIEGYRDDQIVAMIDASIKELESNA